MGNLGVHLISGKREPKNDTTGALRDAGRSKSRIGIELPATAAAAEVVAATAATTTAATAAAVTAATTAVAATAAATATTTAAAAAVTTAATAAARAAIAATAAATRAAATAAAFTTVLGFTDNQRATAHVLAVQLANCVLAGLGRVIFDKSEATAAARLALGDNLSGYDLAVLSEQSTQLFRCHRKSEVSYIELLRH
jgi:hypothetical protein